MAAGLSLIQLREKNLPAGVLYELALRAARITGGSATRLLVNDRADIASGAGADGVHLTTTSMETDIVRRTFSRALLIGVSTHSVAEACAARDGGANFVVFGPVFQTASKQILGAPAGLDKLKEVARILSPFPVLALGGVAAGNAAQCLQAGAAGIAGISLFSQASDLRRIVRLVQDSV